ncbi:21917_t:CDS:2, partial [Racocetra persica]
NKNEVVKDDFDKLFEAILDLENKSGDSKPESQKRNEAQMKIENIKNDFDELFEGIS